MNLPTVIILIALGTPAAAAVSWRAIEEQAAAQHAAGQYREAERLYRMALHDLRQAAPRDPHIPDLLNNIGAECHLLAKYTEAEALDREALAAWQNQPAQPEAIARTWTNLAMTLRASGRYSDAEAAYNQALRSLEPGRDRHAAQFALTLGNLA